MPLSKTMSTTTTADECCNEAQWHLKYLTNFKSDSWERREQNGRIFTYNYLEIKTCQT